MSYGNQETQNLKISQQYSEGQVNIRGPILQFKNQLQKLNKKNEIKTRQLKQKVKDRLGSLQFELSVDLSNNGSAVRKNMTSNSSFRSQQIIDQLQIVSLLDSENKNLIDQNRYLTERIRKMQDKDNKFKQIIQKKQKYKKLYIDTFEQLQKVKQQSQIYGQQIRQIKNIALFDIDRLRQDIGKSSKQKNSQDCKSYSSQLYTSDGFINLSNEMRVKTSENQYI